MWEFLACEVFYRGLGGETLTEINAYMAEAVPLEGETFVILQGGINSILTAAVDPNPAMRLAMQAMVDRAVSNNLDYCVINLAPFLNASGWSSSRQSWAESYNAWVATTFDDKYVDMYSALGDAGDSMALSSDYDSGDGLHPNPAGFRAVDMVTVDVLGSAIRPRLDGSQIATNSNFSNGNQSWVTGAGVMVVDGKARSDGTIPIYGNVLRQDHLEAGVKYVATIIVSDYVSGQVRVSLGYSTNGPIIEADGRYTFSGVATDLSLLVRTTADVFVGAIDLVELRKVELTYVNAPASIREKYTLTEGDWVGEESVINGTFDTDTGWFKSGSWAIASGVASITNEASTSTLRQDGVLTIGKAYSVRFEVATTLGSGIGLQNAAGSIIAQASNGMADTVWIADTENIRFKRVSGTVTATLDNVSIKRIIEVAP